MKVELDFFFCGCIDSFPFYLYPRSIGEDQVPEIWEACNNEENARKQLRENRRLLAEAKIDLDEKTEENKTYQRCVDALSGKIPPEDGEYEQLMEIVNEVRREYSQTNDEVKERCTTLRAQLATAQEAYARLTRDKEEASALLEENTRVKTAKEEEIVRLQEYVRSNQTYVAIVIVIFLPVLKQ